MVADWVEVAAILPGAASAAPAGGFDWVLWREDDGVVTAAYVFPRGPAAEAGLREGDVFYMMEYQQYFNAEDLKRAIEGIEPGSVRTFLVQRENDFAEAAVRLARYPTFLYPLSQGLWRFSIWGFTVGAFLHVLGIVIAGPLALRSRRARFALGLILVSSLWMFANGLPPPHGGTHRPTHPWRHLRRRLPGADPRGPGWLDRFSGAAPAQGAPRPRPGAAAPHRTSAPFPLRADFSAWAGGARRYAARQPRPGHARQPDRADSLLRVYLHRRRRSLDSALPLSLRRRARPGPAGVEPGR